MVRGIAQTTSPIIPQFKECWPKISPAERTAVLDMLNEEITNVKGTRILRDFEERFAASTGARYCVAFSSGTAAFVAALASVGVCNGRTVLLPTYAYPACSQAVCSLGAQIYFIDVAVDSLQVDLAHLERSVRSDVACLVLQHAWGNSCNINEARRIALERGIPIVADCSHSFGAAWESSRSALHGNIGVYSLGMGKWVSGGEMGVIVTDDAELADRCLMFSGMGRSRDDLRDPSSWELVESAYGVKSRPHAYAVALASGSLNRVEEKLQRTSIIASEMACAIRRHPWLFLEPTPAELTRVYWRLVVENRSPAMGTDTLASLLRREGVLVLENEYKPLLHRRHVHRFRNFAELSNSRQDCHLSQMQDSCPRAEKMIERLLTLQVPVKPDLDYAARFSLVLDSVGLEMSLSPR